MKSTITAVKDLSTNKWVVRKEMHPVREVTVSFGFKRGDETEFELPADLQFGIKVFRNSSQKEQLVNFNWPVSSKRPFTGDNVSPYLVEQDLVLDIDDTFKLIITGKNGELEAVHESFFSINKPTKPYPSWVWDGNEWIAPVGPGKPHVPDEVPHGSSLKDVYNWDESLGKWVIDVDEPNPRLALEMPDRAIDPANPVG